MNILDCQQEEVLLRKTENSESTLARSTADEIEKVSLYNIKFELNGKKGFAYSSPDLRINRVLAYCENGLIEDTIYIKGDVYKRQSCASWNKITVPRPPSLTLPIASSAGTRNKFRKKHSLRTKKEIKSG